MPLLWLSLAFLGGILLGEWLPWHWAAWLGLGVASLAAWIVLRRFTSPGTSSTWVERFARRMPGQAVPLAAVVLALAAGAGRYQLAHPAPTPGDIAWYNGSGTLVITGMVDEPPNRRESYTSLKVKVRQTAGSMGSSMPQAVRGRVMAILPATDDWQYGDLVELTGAPELPEASFSFTYRDYLARQGISAALYYPRVRLLQSGQGNPFTAAMYAFKQKALRNLEIILPTPEAELLQGIILGVDENIPKDLAQDYITTGTAHIIAISGQSDSR
jgi:competence protein ComEC